MKIFEHVDTDGDTVFVTYEHLHERDPFMITTAGHDDDGRAVGVTLPSHEADRLAEAIRGKVTTRFGRGGIIESTETNPEPTTDPDNDADPVDEDDEDDDTVLTTEQQRRRESIWSARTAIRNTTGNLLTRGDKVESPAALMSIAHYIATGQRDYVFREGEFVERQPEPGGS